MMRLNNSSNQWLLNPGHKTKEMFLVFSQWVADNCHHNVNTQDEKGVFYLMGIIECTIKSRRVSR